MERDRRDYDREEAERFNRYPERRTYERPAGDYARDPRESAYAREEGYAPRRQELPRRYEQPEIRESRPYAEPQPRREEVYDEFGYARDDARREEEPRKKKGFFSSLKGRREDDPVGMNNVVILNPRTFSDVKSIIDSLRNRQAIIVDMNRIGERDYQRILDYLNGAIYALGGGQQRFGDNMYLFTPEGVSIQGTAYLKKKYD